MTLEPEKLIRDHIPAFIRADGRVARLRQLSDADVSPFVRRKVLEEAAEVYEALGGQGAAEVTAELADLLEVMRRAAALAGIPWGEVEAMRERRAADRGAFEENWLLGGLPPDLGRIYGGPESPMFSALHRHLQTCVSATIAVSFGMRSGVELLSASISAALHRGARIRLLTSDYLDITEPDALEELLALTGDFDIRLYHEPGRSFHAKTYIFEDAGGKRVAFVGSSNLSRSALETGIEWNYLARDTDDGWSITELLARFNALFDSSFSHRVTPALVAAYRARRQPRGWRDQAVVTDFGDAGPTPNAPQREALAALTSLRAEGEAKAMIVAATGVGKTYLAAFDSLPYGRVLFVAHREELLTQAQRTFASVRPEARMGLYAGGTHDVDADILFASVGTLARPEHLARFAADRFDYIVIDEFHHAAAHSYGALLGYFAPRFLLGLTATPYRGDNRDVFALCDGNVAYRVTFMEAIGLGWLAPFRYFGVFDETNYADIPWRNGRLDVAALTLAVETQARAAAVLTAYQAHESRAGVGFCVSIAHADFMARFFCEQGIPAQALHSGPGAPPRAEALARLQAGALRVIFTVDLLNEGVDVPAIDLVMFLRPTESVTVFLQQLGRGLRLWPDKPFLTVLDFIGNYKRAHYKLPLILGRLETEPDAKVLREVVRDYQAGAIALPAGVSVSFDLRALDLIKSMTARAEPRRLKLAGAYREVEAALGRRPTLLEMHRHGTVEAKAYRQEFGSWNRFLDGMNALSAEEKALEAEAGSFLLEVEKTAMTKSYKMVVLSSFVRLGGFAAPVSLEALVTAFRTFFLESPRHGRDLEGTAIAEVAAVSEAALTAYVMRNPIAAWTGGPFVVADGALAYVGPRPPAEQLALFEAAIRERVAFRLAVYFEARYERVPAPR